MRNSIGAIAVAFTFCASAAWSQVGTSFTYQGRLTDGSVPANGIYDMQFKLFDALTAGGQIGPTAAKPGLSVTAGAFTATLDFGAAAFTAGAKRWLEISVKLPAAADYTVLSPRVELTPTPNAMFATSIADGAVTAGKIASNGCTAGQVLQYNGNAWVCASVGVLTGCGAIDLLPCYSGPAGTLNIGLCRAGYRSCDAGTGTFGVCSGTVLPVTEVVGDNLDNHCDGPNVVSTEPVHLATGVSVNLFVTATFSDAVGTATLTPATFTLVGPLGPVTGTVSFPKVAAGAGGATSVIFTPDTLLASNTTYTATLTDGVRDPSGTPMSAPYIFSFTTAPGPLLSLTQPSGVQHSVVPIAYTLADSSSEPASIVVEFSIDSGSNWSPATRLGGELTTGLATSTAGTSHAFAWNAFADSVALAGPIGTVRIRITPTTESGGGAGPAVSTTSFSVDNNYSQVIGTTTGVFVRDVTSERTMETPLGNLVADAMRAAVGTQVFMQNGGSIRASLPSAFVPTGPPLVRSGCSFGTPCDLVMGDVYAVLPFGNEIVTLTVTGAQIWQALEHSVSFVPAANGAFMQVSGLTLTYQLSAPSGSRVQSVSLAGGGPIASDATTYTLAVSDFAGAGGDGYTAFSPIPKTHTRKMQADVLLAHIMASGPLTPLTAGRITQVP